MPGSGGVELSSHSMLTASSRSRPIPAPRDGPADLDIGHFRSFTTRKDTVAYEDRFVSILEIAEGVRAPTLAGPTAPVPAGRSSSTGQEEFVIV